MGCGILVCYVGVLCCILVGLGVSWGFACCMPDRLGFSDRFSLLGLGTLFTSVLVLDGLSVVEFLTCIAVMV